MQAAHWLICNVYKRASSLDTSLPFPDPLDEFYGYTNRTVRLPDGKAVPCTRNLARTTGWAATALLAFQANQYVVRKRDCAQMYRAYIDDERASLLENIATYCRDEWQYLIPTTDYGRKHLREICEQTLGFERHFLTRYTNYLGKG